MDAPGAIGALGVMAVLFWGAGLWACSSPPSHDAPPPLVSPAPDTEEEEAVIPEEDLPEEEAEPVLPQFVGLPVSSFTEIWGYLISGREQELNSRAPLTDIGYFGAEINSYGQLIGVPNSQRLASFRGRVHLVAACNGQALTHFTLLPGSAERKQLVADLLAAAASFDGLQIDFENVPSRDGDAFRSFLAELRAGLGARRFTIALPARTRTLANDVYDYTRILPLVDRILVMAYDEHWSTSAPGPVASMNWCRSVASYALQTIGAEKLIMGMPFYGRTWGNVNTFRAFYHSGIERIKRENDVAEIHRENDIPSFRYTVPVEVTVYYDDDYSLSRRAAMYRAMGVRAVGFWSLGQESPSYWSLIQREQTP